MSLKTGLLGPVLLMSLAAPGWCWSETAGVDWPHYLGDEGRSHFSPLTQIDRSNVRRLAPVWTFRGGRLEPAERTQIQCNPLVLAGVLYGTTARQHLVALDAATGRELWRFDPRTDGRSRRSDPRHRGVAACSRLGVRRLLFAHDCFLYAIDPEKGRLITTFGDRGAVDFGAALAPDGREVPVGSGTPGVIFDDIYVLTTRTSEVAGAAPGHILAFNVVTGERAWTFHTIPQPGEPGHDTWSPDSWKTTGGANCWAGMALDAARGLLYVPTGSPTYDFWGGDRRGDNLYGNALICLDARTGRRIWHRQLVRHDLWDRDLPAPPTLVTVRRGGQVISAVAQVTKSGHVFVFDRQTGEPVFPWQEVPAPASTLDGEVAARFQPLPKRPAPLARQTVSVDDLTTLSPAAHEHALRRFASLRPSVPFQPPSLEGTIVAPGQDGGAQWGGAAIDPAGMMVVNVTDIPGILTMVDARMGARGVGGPGASSYLQFCAGCHGADRAGAAHQNIPALTNVVGRLSRDQVTEVIANGRGQMPPFKFLPDEVRGDLADFLLGVTPRTVPIAVAAYKPSTSVGAPYGHVFERWADAEGYPAVKPPWGTLNRIDLNTGEYLWRVPLGEIKELTARGLPPTGTSNYGGPVVTAGGLIFIAATPDRQFRAFDADSGRVLWSYELPAAGYATPVTYLVGGRQYVVIACGGGKLGSPSDDLYLAFALPN